MGASLLIGCHRAPRFDPPENPEPLTGATTASSTDVGHIAYTKCATCHHPGSVAPFSLLSANDFSKRRRQIIEVLTNGYMPPWPPTPGINVFKNDRGLRSSEKRILIDWLERGAPTKEFRFSGNRKFEKSGHWALGEPDVILRLENPYVLAADSDDVFRTFVIKAPWDEPLFVRGFDFHPLSPQTTHHMVLEIDHTEATRELAESDPISGFDGFLQGNSTNPVGGQFFGWSPGRDPFLTLPGMQWRLDPGVDIVLRLHLQSTGKDETINPALALYTTNRPPTLYPYLTWLTTGSMKIRAGNAKHIAIAEKTLKKETVFLSVYPHAHYLCSDVMAYAEFPNGEKQWLIHINRWDFNWQGEFRYEQPIRLPAGTKIVSRFRYDNSASNPMNPHNPPKRVLDGPRASDEMGDIWFVSIDARAWDAAKEKGELDAHP